MGAAEVKVIAGELRTGANSGHDKLKIRIYRDEQLQSAKLSLRTPISMAQLQLTFHYHTRSFLVAD